MATGHTLIEYILHFSLRLVLLPVLQSDDWIATFHEDHLQNSILQSAKACCGHQVHLSCGGAGHLHIYEILRKDTQDGKALGRGRGNAASLRRCKAKTVQIQETNMRKDQMEGFSNRYTLYLPRKSSHIGFPVEIMIKIDIGRLHYLLYILCLSYASCLFASLRNSCRSSSPWPDNPESCSLWERPKRFWSDIRS